MKTVTVRRRLVKAWFVPGVGEISRVVCRCGFDGSVRENLQREDGNDQKTDSDSSAEKNDFFQKVIMIRVRLLGPIGPQLVLNWA